MTSHPSSPIAPVSKRVIAYIIDMLIPAALITVGVVIMGIMGVAAAAAGDAGAAAGALVVGGIFYLAALAWGVIYIVMLGGKGSVGMRAQRIRLVREDTGAPLGFGYALLRYIVFALTASVIVGYFSPLFDKSGRLQGWHDRVAKSIMINASAANQGSDAASAAVNAPPLPPMPAPAHSFAAPTPPAPPVPVPPAPSFPSDPAFQSDPGAAPEETVVAHRPSAPASGAGHDGGVIAFVPGITQETSSAPVAAKTSTPERAEVPVAPSASVTTAESAPSGAQRPVSDFDADDEDIESTRISVPGHRLVFTWDDGTRTEVSRRTIFGRNPAAETGAATVSVRDETLSLSKTHFEAAAEAVGGWVLDRHSTNGMTIIRGGERISCPAGQKVRVRLGDAIEIGDRIVTIGGYV